MMDASQMTLGIMMECLKSLFIPQMAFKAKRIISNKSIKYLLSFPTKKKQFLIMFGQFEVLSAFVSSSKREFQTSIASEGIW